MDEVDFEPDEPIEAPADMEAEKPAAADEGKKASGGGGGSGGAAGGAGGSKKKAAGARMKGRGERGARSGLGGGADRYAGRGGVFESVAGADGSGPCRSVEGWILFITGIHEEAQEDQILDAFAEYGEVKNINVNLDRRTGYVKGYALVEFEKKEEAEEAIKEMDGKDFLGQKLAVDWAFLKSKTRRGKGRR